MILKVVDVSLTIEYEWLFKLTNSTRATFFIMNEAFYDRNHKTSPITRGILDYLDKGHRVDCIVDEIEGRNVVIQVVR